ncbi:hypothetical protein ACHAQJ_010533 [Trichoderma viride]
MSSRPRRSAAAKAKEVISVHARWADTSEKEDAGTTMSSRRTGRGAGASASRDTASSPEETHLSVTVKLPPNRLRQTTRGGNRQVGDAFDGGEIVLGKRNRGAKKSYVIDSSPDDEEEEEEDEVEVEDEEDEEEDDEEDEDEEDTRAEDDAEMEELGDEDAEGEDEMDVDAEGEEDADGDVDMAPKRVARPLAKNSRPTKPRPMVKVTTSRATRDEEEDDDDDDDDELSDPADSDIGDDTIVYGDQTMADDEDAEGEEIEVAGDEDDVEEEEEEEDEITMPPGANGDSDLDSEEGSRAETPDLAKMTKRQRARFEDIPQEFMKLPDEIQVKKVFTAEELSMRRQEMARRRRNLSEKRNEEVKMETINKLLKKQAPKINRKAAAAAAAADSLDRNLNKANPIFIRWISNKSGSRIGVPEDIIEGPSGTVFGDKTQQPSRKLVTEVA